ncbi:hypothetical protein OG607_24540 [Streptomyces sp. NBC_01537]|uniref:hypothetical protein n=1 Tax=Streptomyces sp. NBC_01537 TaxID=2903896 RepID=UPI00386FC0D9
MAEDFETILKAGTADFATQITPHPAPSVRARGEQLLRRRRTATAALAVALMAAVAGGAFAATGLSLHSTSPAAVATQRTTSTGSCRSLVVPQAVKDAVTEAYRQSQTGLVHIAPVKGSFYYGTCDGTSYAATKFTPASGATLGEQVQLQDEGSTAKYFTKPPNGTWTYVATDGFPSSPRGCAAIPQIPASLAALWADCK